MRPRQTTDAEILETAREVFLKHGPKAAVSEIAEILGISQPALFKRFGTKKNLLLEAFKLPVDVNWYKIAEKGPDDRPFTEQLTDLAIEIHASLTELIPLIQATHQSGIHPKEFMLEMDEPPPLKARRLLAEWLERCFTKGLIRQTDFHIAAGSILGLVQMDTITTAFMNDQHLPYRMQIAQCTDFIWHGLKPEDTSNEDH